MMWKRSGSRSVRICARNCLPYHSGLHQNAMQLKSWLRSRRYLKNRSMMPYKKSQKSRSKSLSLSAHPTAIRLVNQMLAAIKPPPDLKVDDWADTYRRLSPEAAAEPGLWNTDRAAYQRGMMQAI